MKTETPSFKGMLSMIKNMPFFILKEQISSPIDNQSIYDYNIFVKYNSKLHELISRKRGYKIIKHEKLIYHTQNHETIKFIIFKIDKSTFYELKKELIEFNRFIYENSLFSNIRKNLQNERSN